MKTPLVQFILLFAFGFAGQFTARGGSPPVVTGVTATQRPLPSKLVDISYTISDPDSTSINIGIAVSKDSGATWTVPASSFTGSGAPGVNINVTATPTGKAVVWDAGADWGGHFTTHCRVRVLANDDGLILVPAGSYTRGNFLVSSNGSGDPDITDAPAYSVDVSAFLMDSTLVTGGKWNLVRETYANSHGYTFDNIGLFKAANHPVHTVNWYDATKWCNARSEMEGVTPVYYADAGFTTVYRTGQIAPYVKPGANGYRLPTEAEWEKAARGGLSGKRFPWGDTISTNQANYYGTALSYNLSGAFGYHPAYATGGFPYTSPVGSFAANGYGLFDMAGNVFEWCWDWYSSTYYASGQSDPQGPGTIQADRILRGAAWDYSANYARCANRLNTLPTLTSPRIGFRCVKGL